jgi:S-adenosylmethionine:tRNA ribosyltransferase-isomerase
VTLVDRSILTLPEGDSATAPPETRGLDRDQVRLMVARPDSVVHTRFRDLSAHLEAGDLLVVNTSATVPAAVDGQRNGAPVTVHFSTPVEGSMWIVELRSAGGRTPLRDVSLTDEVSLPGGARLDLVASYPRATIGTGGRLWRALIDSDEPVPEYLARYGRPIAYDYVEGRWPLSDYQTVFARRPGSSEMPSAARPFSPALVTELVAAGIVIAPVLLHTGVSSQEVGEGPFVERFEVPATTARLVNLTRAAGGRVVAVGTTVTRALESVALPDGTVVAGRGQTDLVLGSDRPARTVTGLITGWHPAKASHLSLLEAVAGRELVQTAYEAAAADGYLWHEFGDSCLLLP